MNDPRIDAHTNTGPRHFELAHANVTRRWLLRSGSMGLAALASSRLAWGNEDSPELERAIAALEPYLTPAAEFRDVSRGKPVPHSLPEETKREVGMTRDTWRLQVISDTEHPADLDQELTTENGKALDFQTLQQLTEKNRVRFAKVMTCLNIGCPLGMGIWEGVPLRDVLWMAKPTANLRRVFYYGYHNDKPEQIFRSSLPVGRVLEDPSDVPPVILCTKLNGEWLSSERGGPVRVIVPEAYGFKSIKWLSHLVLSNIPHANDTYAEKNNDVDSPLKTFAATIEIPFEVKPNTPFAVTGYAQSGISGLKRVEVWLQKAGDKSITDTQYFSDAPWQPAEVLDPPADWGTAKQNYQIPQDTLGFDSNGKPAQWPMRLSKVHWGFLCQGLPEGEYQFRCRTVDQNGTAQPLPRPFRKSGHAAIERKRIKVVS